MQQKRSFSSSDKRIRKINERYALTISDIADILDVTPRTLSRWSKNRDTAGKLSERKSDNLAVLEAILKLGERVLGSEDELNQWLHSPVFALGGKKPVDLIKTESGRRRVEEVLHQIELGIY
ncbi:MAG: hypothetical protein Kow0098_26230 [Ignavibacteriaceae bacterium]